MIPNEIERENIYNFKNTLISFFYSKTTIERIENIIDKKSGENNTYINKLFNMDNNNRKFIEIDTFSTGEIYNILRSNIYIDSMIATADNIKMDSQKLYELITDINNVENNTITINNNKYKLFKFLIKNGIVSKRCIDNINSIKTKKDKYYLCISRNPIDYLFCSTDQPFTSCENLNSDYHQSLYLGLPATIVDPNRCITFITNGKLQKYVIKGKTFHHFSYIQRSWGLLFNNCGKDLLIIVRNYPSKKFNISNIIYNNTKIESLLYHDELYYDELNRKEIRSKFSFQLPSYNKSIYHYEHNDYTFPFVYLDFIGITNNDYIDSDGDRKYLMQNPVWYFITDIESKEGCYLFYGSSHFSMQYWTFGFDKLLKPYELYIKQLGLHYNICDDCGNETDILYFHAIPKNDGTYLNLCENCFSEKYMYCINCNKVYEKIKIKKVYSIDTHYGFFAETYFCKECLKNHTTRCPTCKRYFTNKINRKCPECITKENSSLNEITS